jgi:Family of unknown function (DUF6348)
LWEAEIVSDSELVAAHNRCMSISEVLPLFAEFLQSHLERDAPSIQGHDDLLIIETASWSGLCRVLGYNDSNPEHTMVALAFKMTTAAAPTTTLIDTAVGLCPTWQEAVMQAGHAWLEGMYQVIQNSTMNTPSELVYRKKKQFLQPPAQWKLFESLVRVRGLEQDLEPALESVLHRSFAEDLRQIAEQEFQPGQTYWVKVTHTVNQVETVIDCELNNTHWESGHALMVEREFPALHGELRVIRWCALCIPG